MPISFPYQLVALALPKDGYTIPAQVLLQAAALVYCVWLVITLLGVAYLLWNALLGIVFLLWHLPWHQLALSSFTAALASLLVQAWLANCSSFYAQALADTR